MAVVAVTQILMAAAVAVVAAEDHQVAAGSVVVVDPQAAVYPIQFPHLVAGMVAVAMAAAAVVDPQVEVASHLLRVR